MQSNPESTRGDSTPCAESFEAIGKFGLRFENQSTKPITTTGGRSAKDVIVQATGIRVADDRRRIERDLTGIGARRFDQLSAGDRSVVIGVRTGQDGRDRGNQIAGLVTEHRDGSRTNQCDSGNDQTVFDEALTLSVTKHLTHGYFLSQLEERQKEKMVWPLDRCFTRQRLGEPREVESRQGSLCRVKPWTTLGGPRRHDDELSN